MGEKDYGDGKNAHLTLYDGDSRAFAEDLLRRLKTIPAPCFKMDNIELERLASSKTSQPSAFNKLYAKIDTAHFQKITRSGRSPQSVRAWCPSERLRTIEAIWRHLGTIQKKVGRCLTEKDLRLPEFAPMASVATPYVHSAEGAL